MTLTDPELVSQVRQVLRLKPGETIELGDGAGTTGVGQIVTADARAVTVELGAIVQQPRPALAVTLYCAVLKRENFEWVVQKATEIGVSSIVPILTRRTVKQQLRLERLKRIAKEAIEQSGQAWLPMIGQPVPLAEALDQASQSAADLWAFHPELDKTAAFKPLQAARGLFIGPEGGWSDQELDLLQAHQVQFATLGNSTLRAETAAIIASFLAVSV